jgi:CRISPR system Cascade subunit CasE
MLELRIDPEALISFAQNQGINRNRDEDLGYAMHAWTKALFQELAPKPFRLLQGRALRFLAYSQHASGVLRDQAQTFANPLALGVTRIDDLQYAKQMPEQWKAGRRLGFEVLFCPTSRKDGHEKDLYRHYLERQPQGTETDSREKVYSDWLVSQFAGAARLETVRMEHFRFVSQYRRGIKVKLQRPQVSVRGVLQIEDSDRFSDLLARGIGRHRAFGYGMLLLRPA